MANQKTSRINKKVNDPRFDEDTKGVCFVISPIGAEGSERHKKFKDVLEYIIKPAVKSSGYRLRVLRADEIEQPGSFIKDILRSLLDSYVVIADLTEQNPNVFYELGVRHSLSPRTILIAQSVDDIPSDLREYRAITYDMSARGAATFAERLSGYLKQIFEDPHRADNPVLDRLPSVLEERTIELEKENSQLKEQINSILKKGLPESRNRDNTTAAGESVGKRVDRILIVKRVERQYLSTRLQSTSDELPTQYFLPRQQGNFDFYLLKEDNQITEAWYVSVVRGALNVEVELADVRALMEVCSQVQSLKCKFIIAADENLSTKTPSFAKVFNKMKTFVKPEAQHMFHLEIWDTQGLLTKEKELGIKMDL